jgi:hypothetical protein
MEQVFISLAYQYVALALMLTEANYALHQINVPGWQPVSATNVVSCYISPPRLRRGGSFDTETHSFGFGTEGRLQFIQRLDPEPEIDFEERHERWAKMTSHIGTNEAYQLATNWLIKLDVDVPALEKAYPLQVTQESYYRGGKRSADRVAMLPRYEVKWGTNPMLPAVSVSIFGPTKEPIHIRQNDSSFSGRPSGLIKDIERLLAITNRDFAGYSLAQKSNLVATSAVGTYLGFFLPELVPAKSAPAPKARRQDDRRTRPSYFNRLPDNQGTVHTVGPAKPATNQPSAKP